MKTCWSLAAPALALALAVPAAVSAKDFRVETEVFVGAETRPLAENLTLFLGDVVYDFMVGEPREITVLDARRGRLVLLDTKRKVKTTLTTDELLQFTAAIRAEANRHKVDQPFGTEFASKVDAERMKSFSKAAASSTGRR